MQQIEFIKKSIEYIEDNLKTDIVTVELANMAGYSIHHFHRLFTGAMGISLAYYILKRRISHAIYDMSCGKSGIDVVLEYGFTTYAGFYKAFIKEFGCSPKRYLKLYRIAKPQIISFEKDGKRMYTQKQIYEILKAWDVEGGLPIEDIRIMGGTKIAGDAWYIGDEYVLKASADIRPVMQNSSITKALMANGITAGVPILTKAGTEYVDGEKIFVLTRRLKGKPLEKQERVGESRLHYANAYGNAIAKLHAALRLIDKEILADDVDIFDQVSNWALPDVKKQNLQWSIGIPDDFFDNYINEFGKLYPHLPKQLIHRNPNPSTLLFIGQEVSGIIDFELSQRNIRLLDPCYCATGILVEAQDNYDSWIDILAGIINGYDRLAKLSSYERKAIYYVLCASQMICVAYFGSKDEFKALAQVNRCMLKFIVDNKEKIQSI